MVTVTFSTSELREILRVEAAKQIGKDESVVKLENFIPMDEDQMELGEIEIEIEVSLAS